MKTKRTFGQWRKLYFGALRKSDEALDLFQEMLMVAKFKEEFQELLRIIWSDDLLPLGHPVIGFCTTGVCVATMYSVPEKSPR
ncbi:MAG: hypothetical protein AAB381_01895 [Patescibacteria group bacterium]